MAEVKKEIKVKHVIGYIYAPMEKGVVPVKYA